MLDFSRLVEMLRIMRLMLRFVAFCAVIVALIRISMHIQMFICIYAFGGALLQTVVKKCETEIKKDRICGRFIKKVT